MIMIIRWCDVVQCSVTKPTENNTNTNKAYGYLRTAWNSAEHNPVTKYMRQLQYKLQSEKDPIFQRLTAAHLTYKKKK